MRGGASSQKQILPNENQVKILFFESSRYTAGSFPPTSDVCAVYTCWRAQPHPYPHCTR